MSKDIGNVQLAKQVKLGRNCCRQLGIIQVCVIYLMVNYELRQICCRKVTVE